MTPPTDRVGGDSKSRLRQELKAAATSRSPADREAASHALVQRLLGLPLWQGSRGVLGFHPLQGEPDLRPLLATALAEGKWLALPRFDAGRGAYVPALVSDLDRDLVTGRYGVLEPGSGCPVAGTNQLDLALIPGVGFDFTGGRLGRGGGFYDRLLAGLPDTVRCGVAFDWQLTVAIPMDPHDVAMDSLLTPGQWRSFRPGEGG